VLAADHKLKSIGFPAISTGIYGYPKEKAATVAFSTVYEFLQQNELPQEVHFVFFSKGDTDAFLEAISGLPGAGEL
jgi:O-acetyl-ADP-ribose deacetylase (regulator of RNase III)